MSGNSCYILCSLECIDFFNTEVEPPTEAIAPHQKQIVGEYVHDNSASNTNTVREANGTTTAAEDDDATDNNNTNSASAVESNPASAIATSIGHALNNCALEDIRDRLGYPKTAPAPTIAAPTTTFTTTNALTGITTTNTVPAFNIYANVHHASCIVRFKSLSEIPNFYLRYNKSTARVKSLLYKLCNDIALYQETLLKSEGDATKADAGSCTNTLFFCLVSHN
jgi:hypothetical protein